MKVHMLLNSDAVKFFRLVFSLGSEWRFSFSRVVRKDTGLDTDKARRTDNELEV